MLAVQLTTAGRRRGGGGAAVRRRRWQSDPRFSFLFAGGAGSDVYQQRLAAVAAAAVAAAAADGTGAQQTQRPQPVQPLTAPNGTAGDVGSGRAAADESGGAAVAAAGVDAAGSPVDAGRRADIERMAGYVRTHGREAEAVMRRRQAQNPRFSFLFGGSGSALYDKLKSA